MDHWLITTVVRLHVKKHGALWDLVKGEMSLVKPKLRDEAKRRSSPGKKALRTASGEMSNGATTLQKWFGS